jgi:hypothetical protein
MGWLTIDLKADRVLREKFDKRRLLVRYTPRTSSRSNA